MRPPEDGTTVQRDSSRDLNGHQTNGHRLENQLNGQQYMNGHHRNDEVHNGYLNGNSRAQPLPSRQASHRHRVLNSNLGYSNAASVSASVSSRPNATPRRSTEPTSSVPMCVELRKLNFNPCNLKISQSCCQTALFYRHSLNCDNYDSFSYRPLTPPNSFSSDSESASETDDETSSESETKNLVAEAHLTSNRKNKRLKKEIFMNDSPPVGLQKKTLDPSSRQQPDNPFKPLNPTAKPRSARLRPYPYIRQAHLTKSDISKDVVRGVNSNYKGKTLFCLEEYFYCEYTNNKWSFEGPSNTSTAYQYDVSPLGDLGAIYGIKREVKESNNGNKKEKKNKNGKSGSRAKSVSSKSADNEVTTQTKEQIDESKKRLSNLCHNMPNCLPPIHCFDCRSWIKSSIFGRHVFAHFWEKLNRPRDAKRNWCYHCNRLFESDLALKEHYMIVKRFGKYFCMICVKNFSNNEDRMEHMRTYHTRHSMPFVCPICPFSSSTSYQFVVHYEENHSLPICHLCHEVFFDAEALFTSTHRIPSEREVDSFELFNEIFLHMEQHISVGETYACNMCSMSFISASDYVSHQKAFHTNIKLNKMSKMPASHNGFKREDMVIPGDALGLIEFYKDENIMKNLINSIPNITIPACTRAAQAFCNEHAVAKAARVGRRTQRLSADVILEAQAPMEVDPPEVAQLEEGQVSSPNDPFGEGPSGMNVESRESINELEDNNQGALAPSEFDDFFFASSGAYSTRDDKTIMNFYGDQACKDCIKPFIQRSEYDVHLSMRPLSCSAPNCHTTSHCYIYMGMHEMLHISKASIEKIAVFSNLAEDVDRENFLLICFHCQGYFENYRQQKNHIENRRHIIFNFSLERDSLEEKATDTNTSNWKGEFSKFCSGGEEEESGDPRMDL